MAQHSFNTLMRRLSRGGFARQFVTTALMPDWWEESYAKDPAVLPEVEIRVARFLNVSLSAVRNPDVGLMPPSYRNAQLRSIRDISRDRLGPAILTAMRVAEAVIRNLRCSDSAQTSLTDDALEWRRLLTSGESKPVQLNDVLGDLWTRGIPVVPMEVLPAPGFQALACIVDERPVIVLGHRYDEPGRVSFLLAHEAGHIAAGHCTPDMPVLDENEAVQDESTVERVADRFARRLLVGGEGVKIPEDIEMDARGLAQLAFDLERETNVDASSLIYAWAARTLNYADASMAVRALYRSGGARQQVRSMFDRHVDAESASESDRDLLRCLYGRPQPTAVAG